MNNLLSYRGLDDARISAPEKDLSVQDNFFCFVLKQSAFKTKPLSCPKAQLSRKIRLYCNLSR